MPYVATTGTASCATIAIGWFKEYGIEQNEAYKADPSSYTPETGLTVQQFSDKVLFPIDQELGRSMDMPFERLMREIEDSSLATKMVICTINHSQYMQKDGYWPEELKRWGFELVTKTGNNWGQDNYFFIRNPLKKAI